MSKNLTFKLLFFVFIYFTFFDLEAQKSDVNSEIKNETSEYFSVTTDGTSVNVMKAAGSYSFANIDINKPAEIIITALKPDFWEKGVEILPSRLGIRPKIIGNSIYFTLEHAEKIAISRPGDFYANAPILFLFGNKPSSTPSQNDKNLRIYAPGIYHEDIHVKSNETIYLEKGAIIYGSLNFWEVSNAHVFGKGVIIHDGPQNPNDDEGWQHRPNWHGIVAHNAIDISIKDITVLVRSRTWMVQLQGCKDLTFENIKVIGGTRGNANQDGIDWLGCGNTVVRNCFFRCSDDIFAIYGNTGFYDEAVAIPGLDVENILIEGCVLSASISNILRVSWPRKVFNSNNITIKDCDVIHAGQGSCVVPFALAEFWADPDGKGVHSNYTFYDIRLDNVYSVTQLLQPKNGLAKVKNIQFKNIRTLTPPLVNSAITGDCSDISFENIKIGDQAIDHISSLGINDTIKSAKIIAPVSLQADFRYDTGLLKPGQLIKFDAAISKSTRNIRSYSWNFGDGTVENGKVVNHKFSDSEGTLLNGSGQFRVQLTIVDDQGNKDVILKPVVIGTSIAKASNLELLDKGLNYKLFQGVNSNWANTLQATPGKTGKTDYFENTGIVDNSNFSLIFDGYIEIPVSGGYTFYIQARDGSFLQLDSHKLIENNEIEPQSCSTPGNVVKQYSCTSILEKGLHKISFGYKHAIGNDAFALYWQGPQTKLEKVPMHQFFRNNQ